MENKKFQKVEMSAESESIKSDPNTPDPIIPDPIIPGDGDDAGVDTGIIDPSTGGGDGNGQDGDVK